jgi:sulfur carrier protein ThiS
VNANSKTGETIGVTVRLLANLNTYSPIGKECFKLTIARQETVADFLDRFNIPSVLKPIVVINGRPAKPMTRLSDGDSVLVYEPVTGG